MAETPQKFRARENSLKQANVVRRNWVYYPAHGEPLDYVVSDPGYWAHVARLLTIGDWIELCAEDESYWALVRVISVGNVWAKVKVISQDTEAVTHVDLPETAQYAIEWKGPKMRFAVIRLSDKQILKGEFQTRSDAGAWLGNHMKALVA